MSHSFRIVCFTGLVALGGTGLAADYYVAPQGDDANTGAAEAPFATIDKAVLTARTAGDVIHVLPGTYETTLGLYDADNAKWGPNLCVKMVGAGATRDEVVLKSHGTHRTLRMAANAWVENMTLEGEPTFKADRGGVVEMTGGVLTNCVVRNGTTTGNGGNLYMTAGVVADCVISNGAIKSTSAESNGPKGVNVCLNGAARLLRCHVVGGTTTRKDDGTFYYERGSVHVDNASAQIDNCLVEGSACGGLLLQSAGAQVYNTTIVTNVSYGVWSWSANQTFVNCIVYGNVTRDWHGNQPTDAAAKFRNCAMATGVLSKDKFPTLVEISDGDFADPANGDWHPVQGSALVDAGGIDPRGAAASARDLDGNPRMSGVIDIGCYEFQKPDISVRIDGLALDRAYAPATATFTHSSANVTSPDDIAYTYDFGDGSEPETVTAGTATHVYAKPGVYTVIIAVHNRAAATESATMTYEGYVRIASSTVYATVGNTAAAFPYDTPETGFASLREAINGVQDGYTILLEPGVYAAADQTSVTKALTIIGQGPTPESVILRNTTVTPDTYYHRTIELNNAGAYLANVTIEGGCVRNHWGGNLRIANGATVSNCVIRGGLARADNGNAAGGAVVIGGSNAVLTHCVISNNVTEKTSNDKNYAGGAIFLEYGTKGARLSNLLVTGNRYLPSDATKAGTAGIRFGGGNDNTTVENCTIVGNTVVGSLPDDSAGIFCTSWHCMLRNNLIVGNVETEKAGGTCTSVKLDVSDGSNYQYRNNITDDAQIGGSATKSTDNLLVSGWKSLFRNPAAGDYTLKPGSVACNRGTSSLTLRPSVDLAGRPRVFGKAIDIGCYECPLKAGFIISIR